MSVWRWEAFNPDGDRAIADTLTDPFSSTAQHAAKTAMAHLMVRAWPDCGRLAGWRVRAWSGDVEAWTVADEWLPAMVAVSH